MTKFSFMSRISLAILTCILAASAINGVAQAPVADNMAVDAAIDSVVTVLLAADGQAQAVGSGLIVRSDGYILTPYSLVRGASEVRIRLGNGETYDKAEMVTFDERRNIAILRINAAGLRIIPNGVAEETQVGSRIFVLTNPSGQVAIKSDLILNSVQMADSVPGAGKGYRVLQFDAVTGANPIGGLLLDERGRTLGIITTTPEVKDKSIAVPLSSVVGLIRAANSYMTPHDVSTSRTAPYPAASPTPVPIPQGSVLLPQRGVTSLSPKGPGSVVVKPATVSEILAASKTIFVETNTVFFKPEQLINALNERKEMSEWGLSFTNERELADLILEIDHVVLTYKFTFKMYSQRLGTVVATGSRIILDGNVGSPYMAERVIEKLKIARGVDPKPSILDEKKPVEVKKSEKIDGNPDTIKQAPRAIQQTELKSETTLRKLLRDSRSDDQKISDMANKELSGLDAKYLPLLVEMSKNGKPCDRVAAAQIVVDGLDKNNNEKLMVPILVDLARGGNLLSLFNLKEEFMCRRRAAFMLADYGDGIRELTKMLKEGDQWERHSAIFAFDELTETTDYPGDIAVAMKAAIPVIGSFVNSKDEVLQGMSNEVLSQIVGHSPEELTAIAKKYYTD